MSKKKLDAELIKDRLKKKAWYKYRMVLFLAIFFIGMVGMTFLIYTQSKKMSEASSNDSLQPLATEMNALIDEYQDGMSQTDSDAPVYTHELSSEMVDEKIKQFVSEHDGISEKDYTKQLRKLMMKHHETEDFVLHYPLVVKGLEQPNTRGNGNINFKDSVPELYQWDSRWGYQEYSSDVLGFTGCGPTSLSMVAIYLLQDESKTPSWMAEFAKSEGYAVAGNGSSWELMSKGAEKLGLRVEEIALNEASIAEALQEGKPVICIMGPGHFTERGHFVVLTEYIGGKKTDGNLKGGSFIMHDSNCVQNTGRLWKYTELQDQIENLWAYSLPKSYKFRSEKLLKQHYQKHGKDMGFATPEEYEAAASAVVNSSSSLHKTEAEDGDDVYYIEETNEFVVVSTDGFIRTYFNPDGGKKYYDNQ
ncbi:MAG: C39 family peptidase [Eubacterium sp.]|nr:C39 family peptidase [Eubacterium sp.]